MRSAERIVVRGLVAGFIGATVLALWFFAIDSAVGRPFYTPTFLANVLAGAQLGEPSFGMIAMYTALHYAAFFAVGIAVAWVLSRLEAAPTMLLGAVLGFLLFDLVFYFSVVFTGVDVVQELGWPGVLFGNVLAGVGMMAYLGRTMKTEAVSWLQWLSNVRLVREGVIAGLIGAVSVALWFLVFDLIRGQLLFTPGALGSALFLGVRDLADVQVNLLTVFGYTAFHILAFVLAGTIAAAIAVEAERAPALVLLGILLFVTFEAFFIGLLAVAAQWLLGTLGWGAIGAGNLIATVAMAVYLLKVHPELRAALLSETLSEDAPDEAEPRQPVRP